MRRRAALFAGGAVAAGGLWLAGCASDPDRGKPEDEDPGQQLWPLPPERPRFAYELALRSLADIQRLDDDGRLRRALTGERAPTQKLLDKPAAVVARGGRIYVADTVRRGIVVFDVPRGKVFGFGGRKPGTLAKPIAMALDDRRLVYVADATLRRVMVYDHLGLFLREIGSPDDLQRPTGVAVDGAGERIYVIDRASNDSDAHRVLIYDAGGRKLAEIGQRGRGDGEFNVPVQGVVDAQGRLHVLDAGNFRVQTFDAEGRFLRAFGSVGNGIGQFARPRGIACDPDGNLYVTDASFGNVQVFDPQGQLLLAIGRTGRADLPGRFGLLTGVCVDETRRIYLVDQLFSKIEVLRRLEEAEARDLQARGATSARG
jgi:DNA-binding beta-propeller fold protein YncE